MLEKIFTTNNIMSAFLGVALIMAIAKGNTDLALPIITGFAGCMNISIKKESEKGETK